MFLLVARARLRLVGSAEAGKSPVDGNINITENRSMTFNTFDNDVMPLKIKCSPICGSRNNSFNVQQTQKSFSTICGSRLRGVAVPSKKILRSSGFSFTNVSMRHPLAASRCMMFAIHAGAYARSFNNCFRSSAESLRSSRFTVSSVTCALPRYRNA